MRRAQGKIAAALGKARKARGLTQQELALKLGIAVRTVARWENDEAEPREGKQRRALASTLQDNELHAALGLSTIDPIVGIAAGAIGGSTLGLALGGTIGSAFGGFVGAKLAKTISSRESPESEPPRAALADIILELVRRQATDLGDFDLYCLLLTELLEAMDDAELSATEVLALLQREHATRRTRT